MNSVSKPLSSDTILWVKAMVIAIIFHSFLATFFVFSFNPRRAMASPALIFWGAFLEQQDLSGKTGKSATAVDPGVKFLPGQNHKSPVSQILMPAERKPQGTKPFVVPKQYQKQTFLNPEFPAKIPLPQAPSPDFKIPKLSPTIIYDPAKSK